VWIVQVDVRVSHGVWSEVPRVDYLIRTARGTHWHGPGPYFLCAVHRPRVDDVAAAVTVRADKPKARGRHMKMPDLQPGVMAGPRPDYGAQMTGLRSRSRK
jgi:hypothetical protein